MLGGLCLSDRIALLLGLEYVGWSLLSDSITLLLGFKYAGWSLLVKGFNFTPRT